MNFFVYSDVHDNVKLGFSWSKNVLNIAEVTLHLLVKHYIAVLAGVAGRRLV